MRLHKATACFLLLGLVCLGVGHNHRAQAADGSDLREFYVGSVHHTTVAGNESQDVQFQVESVQPNGKFSGQFAGLAVTGKVTSAGKITFAGGEPSVKIKKGKAQLSATGRYIVGSYTYDGPGNGAPADGKYIFSLESGIITVAHSRF